MVIFPELDPHHGIQYNFLNFDTIMHAMMLLFVVGTGSEWTDFVDDFWEMEPEGVSRVAWDALVIFYFVSFLIILYFLFLNIFIMVGTASCRSISETLVLPPLCLPFSSARSFAMLLRFSVVRTESR